jgi:hypothetical protein
MVEEEEEAAVAAIAAVASGLLVPVGATCNVTGCCFPGVEAGVPGTVEVGVVGTRVSCEGAVTEGADGMTTVPPAVVVVVVVLGVLGVGVAFVVAALAVDLSGLGVLPLMPTEKKSLKVRVLKGQARAPKQNG